LDLSVFLCSLLRGCGYNAYCVSGYAPQWITQQDQSSVECPQLVAAAAAEAEARRPPPSDNILETKDPNRYKIKQNPEHKSKYLAARRQEIVDADEKKRLEEEERIRFLQQKAKDPLHGDRVHCWVLVMKGRREITQVHYTH
jgi:hypothetical protein